MNFFLPFVWGFVNCLSSFSSAITSSWSFSTFDVVVVDDVVDEEELFVAAESSPATGTRGLWRRTTKAWRTRFRDVVDCAVDGGVRVITRTRNIKSEINNKFTHFGVRCLKEVLKDIFQWFVYLWSCFVYSKWSLQFHDCQITL